MTKLPLLRPAARCYLGIAIPVLIGNEAKIRIKAQTLGLFELAAKAEFVAGDAPAVVAARMARDGQVDLLLKGHLRTDELLRAALDKENGLRTGRLLSDVLLYEDTLAGEVRLVGITDGGLNVLPNLEQKKQIVQNAIEVMRCLGLARPKIAIMSATEAVTDSVPSSVDARLSGRDGRRRRVWRCGHLRARWRWTALYWPRQPRQKALCIRLPGHADCMVVPNIESGNLLGKSVKYLGGSQCAHVVVGAKVPILIPSRVESVDDKINSIALGVIFAAR